MRAGGLSLTPESEAFASGSFVHGEQRDVQRDFFSGCSGYGAILADPPWRFETWSDAGRGRSPDGQSRAAQRRNSPENHYPTMTLDELKAMPVGALAAKDCVLIMWFVDSHLPQALELGAAWGFTYRTMGFTWAKLRNEGSTRDLLHDEPAHKLFPIGTGYWLRANPENSLLFTRGEPKRKHADVRRLIVAPRREHSRKPDDSRKRMERLVEGPYLELFAREAAPGWDAWGNQTERFTEVAA
ncbi:MAG TPA: MT-A70 family methyltransferase [Caulobacterales bacterium]|nr:MT-A70 family methyltransferase [Caulobacterales bacterium]